MSRIAERIVLFADLRGSTALFESLGNARATAVVTQCIDEVALCVSAHQGTVVKTLGDGLMAVFDTAADAFACARRMQDTLGSGAAGGSAAGRAAGLPRPLRLQVALAGGEVVEMGGDCYGDAVNVAARLLDHAGDGEVLVTARVGDALTAAQRSRLRRLDSIALRGRVEPVAVYALDGRRLPDSPATDFAAAPLPDDPDGVRLTWAQHERIFDSPSLPIVIGRSAQAAFRVDDPRVSRTHARLDWHGGSFQLTDLSSNGTYVRFADGEVVSLRRGRCTLHGHGGIGLGGSPAEAGSAVVGFDVVRFGDTQT